MKPQHLKQKIHLNADFFKTDALLKKSCLSTVCQKALCPNRHECFSQKVATFLVLGHVCTRSCKFCQIGQARDKLLPPDSSEGKKIIRAAKILGLKHIVITMVTRDDLKDGGALHLAQILRQIHEDIPEVTTEVLTSDFQGRIENLTMVLKEKPTVFNHNVETCKELTPLLRNYASYERSLLILKEAKKNNNCLVKSGFMVGLGETDQQVKNTLLDLKESCDIVTIGQYLQPSPNLLPVKEYILLEKFTEWKEYGETKGIPMVFSGPYIRSSYSSLSQIKHFVNNSK
jgi:lipoic acid synthetase